MRKKVYFSEIVFTNEFYIDGIDVFNNENVEYIKSIDIDLQMNLSFSKIDNAKVYLIKNLNKKIVIAEVRDFKIVCYMKSNMFFKICNHPRNQESLIKNHYLLEAFVIEKIKKTQNDNILYSPNYKTRAVISNDNGVISVQYQTLETFDEIDFYFYEDISSDNFWMWENLEGVSYFDSEENAKEEAASFLSNYVPEPNIYFEKPYVSLWEYQLSRIESLLYMMKFVMVGPVVFILLSCLLPLLGQSNWNILWLTGGCALFTFIFASIVMWNNIEPISYEITDEGIVCCKGMFYTTTFDNIKSVKVKKNIFNKKRGSIKFKLFKGSSINYNFDNIENVEEAYNIIKNKTNHAGGEIYG